MKRKPKGVVGIGIIFAFLTFLLFGIPYFSSAYGDSGVLGVKPPAQITTGAGEDQEDPEEGATSVVDPSEGEGLPVKVGEVSSMSKEAIPFRLTSGFDAFNAGYQNQWKASFSKKTGRVKTLYGFTSKRYEDGPETVARGFLRDSHTIFGLKQDLSDLKLKKANKTPHRIHVKLQQTHQGVPIAGAFVLVHSNKQNQVTMVQNGYIQDFSVANEEWITEESAKDISRNDLRASLGDNAILSDARAEKLIIRQNQDYHYVWKVIISTRKPMGYWVYHVDAANGQILYRGNEIHSLTYGQGRAYVNNAAWHLGRISNVTLRNLFALNETNPLGELFGTHADILDDSGSNPSAPNYRFLYDPYDPAQKDWFDATQAYYHLNTTWNWWNANVVNKYVRDDTYPDFPHYVPFFSDNYPIPTIVNLDECNAYYHPAYDFYGDGILLQGFLFGNDNACAPGSEDLVIDEDVVRHEYTHAMMHWAGFEEQFGGAVDGYGRSMGEGNADFFAFLKNPKDTLMGDVAWAWSPEGYLRNLNNTRRYPDDVPDPGLGVPEEHYTGEIWGGYLYDLYRILGRSALKYIFQSFYYFDATGGHVSGEPDFHDGVDAQYQADYDVAGGNTSLTMKAYGSMVSRGFSNAMRPVYGTDSRSGIYWLFPPTPSLATTGNFLNDGDEHEYGVMADRPGMDLTVSVAATWRSGLINPTISLYSPEYDSSGIPTGNGHEWTTVGPTTPTTAQLKWWNLIPGQHYVIMVRGTATNPGASRYTFKVLLR